MKKAIELDARIVKILNEKDFSVIGEITDEGNRGYSVELETYSPEGEDVIVDIFYDGSADDFVRQFREYAADFDPDDHVELWIDCRGERGVPESIRALMDDAEEIKRILVDTALALGERKIEEPEEIEEIEDKGYDTTDVAEALCDLMDLSCGNDVKKEVEAALYWLKCAAENPYNNGSFHFDTLWNVLQNVTDANI